MPKIHMRKTGIKVTGVLQRPTLQERIACRRMLAAEGAVSAVCLSWYELLVFS